MAVVVPSTAVSRLQMIWSAILFPIWAAMSGSMSANISELACVAPAILKAVAVTCPVSALLSGRSASSAMNPVVTGVVNSGKSTAGRLVPNGTEI